MGEIVLELGGSNGWGPQVLSAADLAAAVAQVTAKAQEKHAVVTMVRSYLVCIPQHVVSASSVFTLAGPSMCVAPSMARISSVCWHTWCKHDTSANGIVEMHVCKQKRDAPKCVCVCGWYMICRYTDARARGPGADAHRPRYVQAC